MSPLESFPWKETFFQEDFSIHHCLSTLIQRANLDKLKSYLKNYGEELHQLMAEILKTETEAIVNLAEYLTNLNTKIDDLTVSLSQLQEELKLLHNLIKNADEDYKKTLDNKELNELGKNRILARIDFISLTLYVENIIRSMKQDEIQEIVILERAVSKYSFQCNHLLELKVIDRNDVIVKAENKLLNILHQCFLKSLTAKDEDSITRCLRMYNNLSKQKAAEDFYQIKIVRPALQVIFSEKNSDKFDQDISKIYSETLKFLYGDMELLNDVLLKNSDLKNSFNFILNSFWVEVDRQCRKTLPHITAPGNPELFQRRFVSTGNLLVEIAKKCGNENLVKTNTSFREHIGRFNLPVYFEIRFQQIASQFERDLSILPSDPSIYIGANDFGFKLKITLNLYVALKKCFDQHVFINQLADHFLKFSMFLLSRYLKWFDDILQQGIKRNQENFILRSLEDVKRSVVFLANEGNDECFENMYKVFPRRMEVVIKKVFESNRRIITEFSNKLSDHLISLKVSECSEQLQNISSIPRLFRRTNRNPPKEASTYMVEAIKIISVFHEANSESDGEIFGLLLDEIVLGITEQYSTLVQDLLQSVCKTEESLRRLKSRNISANDDATSSASPETMTDEMKIREQIKLDINYFTTKLSGFAMLKSKDALKKLENKYF